MRRTPVWTAVAVASVIGLTGCGAGDPEAVAARSSEPSPVSTLPEATVPSQDGTPSATASASDLPTVPPGDPGGDAPSVPEDTSDVEAPHGEPLPEVPQGALLDPETTG